MDIIMFFCKRKSLFARPTVGLLCVCSALFVLGGCDLAKNQMKMDRSTNLEFQDYRDALAPREEVLEKEDQGIPALESYVASGSESLKPMPLVSVAVNQTVPLRDIMFELATQANYDLELDPRIKGSVIFTAKDKPFDVVVNRIAEIAGLRYKFEDETLRVELDTPYSKNYKIDYLPFVRKSKSEVSTNVSVVTGDGTDTGSAFSAESELEADFWAELDANLKQLLESNAAGNALRTERDPRVSVQSTNPSLPPGMVEPLSVEPVDEADLGVEGNTQPETLSPPDVTLQQQFIPLEDENAKDANTVAFTPVFSISKQAGLISVFANERLHKKVDEYMKELKKSITSQVLVEAKILEVSLSDEYAAGIDWNVLGSMSGELAFGWDVTGAAGRPQFDVNPEGNFTLGYTGNDLTTAINAISRFGTVKALASPRLTMMNNQAAVLNVATNEVYFDIDLDIEEGTDGEGDTVSIDTEIKNVPEGVLINVLPSINLDKNTVSMQIRPTITRIQDRVNNPGIDYVAATAGIEIESQVPVLNVQEMDSVLDIKSGQVIVMGGLLQDRTESEENGVPIASEVPLIGNLFKTQQDIITKTELVVLLKATILDGASGVHNTDKELYRLFGQDRRPFRM
jgi:MSHA biogenesis protein MshL